MSISKTIAGTALIAMSVAVIAAALRLTIWASDWGICGNELVAAEPAPGRSYEAVVFVRNCGATTTFATHVSIRDTGTPLHRDDVGDVLAIDASCCSDPRSRVLPRNSLGGPIATVRWVAADTLAVNYAKGVRVVRQAVVHRGIRVLYTTVE